MSINDYSDLYQQAGQQYGVDPALLMAQAQVESGGDPDAVSPAGAKGIAQLMPATAHALGVTDPTDPKQAIPAQAKLMRQNLDKYGDPEAALMAYNAGPNQSHWNNKETQEYPGKVFAHYQGAQVADNSSTEMDPLEARAADVNKNFLPSISSAPNSNASDEEDPLEARSKQTTSSSSFEGEPSVGEKIGAGAERGVMDVVNSKPIMAASQWLEDKLKGAGVDVTAGGLFPTTAQDVQQSQNELNSYDTKYGKSGLAGLSRFGGNLVAALPVLGGAGKVIGAGADALLPESAADFLTGNYEGNKLAQIGSGALAGTGAGAGGAALTSGGSNAPLSDQMRVGAETGGIVGGALPALSNAFGGVKNLLTGGGPSPAVADLAKTAEEKYGIPISGAQISSSPFVHYLDSMTGKVPFSGAPARNEAAKTAFTKAVAGTFGEDADALTPEVMSSARSRIGGVMNDVANKTTIQADDTLLNNLSELSAKTKGLTDTEAKPISNQIENIFDKIGSNNAISGSDYQTLTRKGAPLDIAANSRDPNIRYFSQQVRNELDDALERSASPEDLQALRTARLQYKNLMTVKDIAAKAGVDGEINPNLLAGAVRKSYKNSAFTGAGDIGELSQIGQQFLKDAPSSGTAERLTAMRLINGLNPANVLETGAGAGTALYGLAHPLGAALIAAGTIAGSKGANTFLNSQWYKNALMRAAANPSSAASSIPGASYLPAAAAMLNGRTQ